MPHGGYGRRPRRSHPPPLIPAVEPPTDHAGSMEFISHVVELHAAHVRAAVSSLVCPVAALVLDLFCTPLVDVARELATPAYV